MSHKNIPKIFGESYYISLWSTYKKSCAGIMDDEMKWRELKIHTPARVIL